MCYADRNCWFAGMPLLHFYGYFFLKQKERYYFCPYANFFRFFRGLYFFSVSRYLFSDVLQGSDMLHIYSEKHFASRMSGNYSYHIIQMLNIYSYTCIYSTVFNKNEVKASFLRLVDNFIWLQRFYSIEASLIYFY